MSNNQRLERDLQNRVLGGVCSGLGNYFGVDPTIWRVLFFILFWLGLSGLLIYIILWMVMPAGQPQSNQSAFVQDAETVGEPVKSSGNMTAGLILIGIGAIALLTRYIPQISWRTIWPVILIAIGIFIIIPKNNKKS